MLKAGDVIGFCGRGFVSTFINVGTMGMPCGPWCGLSHVGVMAEYEGRLRLFECTTLSDLPCIIQGRPFSGTQCVNLEDRVATYAGRVFRYPLYRPLYADESRRLTDFAVGHIGRPYDTKGAIESGGWLGLMAIVSGLVKLPSRRAYFCSKESADMLSNCGVFSTDNPAKWNPNALVRHLRKREILLRRRILK